jgi:copper chaperone NosL
MKSTHLRSTLALATALLLTACSVEPEPIAYGSDACVFCRMTIVDKTHAAQMVTRKGKQYKYDAIECLVQHLPEWERESIAHLKVADFGAPGAMVDAETATYLISPGIRSPMGANLSAFGDRSAAEAARDEYSGDLLGWVDLQGRLKADFSLE